MENGDSLRDDVIALKRERILQEAVNLFYERGYVQTTVDAIAERLGGTKQFVYYHFSSKADLLVEICERATGDALAATERVMASKGEPRSRFEEFMRAFTAAALKNHRLVAIYFREEINLPRESVDRINNMRKTINRQLRTLLNEGKSSGDFEIDDPQISAFMLAGMASYAFAWYRRGGALNEQQVTEHVVKAALKLVSPASSHGLDRLPATGTG